MVKDPVELLLSIVAYTHGNWSVEEVAEMYEYICNEVEELENPSPILTLVEGKAHGKETTAEE